MKINENTLKEYFDYTNKIAKLKKSLFQRLKEIFSWENENLGRLHDVTINSNWICKNIEIENDTVWFYVYETWAYGGYDKKEVPIEKYKLVSDDWKQSALKEYQEALEAERIAKELEAEARAIKLEAKKRAELRRLQEKYREK